MSSKNKKVIIGLSGGVDSAVSAYLLCQQGYRVEAVFMQNWDSELNWEFKNDLKHCNIYQDYNDALKISKQLNIKLHKINFIKEYWDKVFIYLINEYKKGFTPNPDILCNFYIKFDLFIKYCQKNYNADYIATGHYCKLIKDKNGLNLAMPSDKNKDQTYFLSQLDIKQLENIIFPLENLTKDKVRQIAKEKNLIVAKKKDSQGICFIGKKNFKEFLSNYFPINKGNNVDIDTNKILGQHDGHYFYTLGQRSNTNISGQDKPYYVVAKNIKDNILYFTNDVNSNYLYINKIIVNKIHWINLKIDNFPFSCLCRYRNNQKLISCKIEKTINNKYLITLNKLSRITSPGQFIVFYDDQICLGSAVIQKIFNNDLECGLLNKK